MTRAYYPVAGCGESRKSGFEREDWGATPSSTPTKALQALYKSTHGENWPSWSQWTGWDFSRTTLPDVSVVDQWHGVTVVGSRVTEIFLYNGMSGTLPSEYGSLSKLQYLNLNANSLSGALPSELGSLSNLQSIYLGGNDLNGTVRFVLA